MARTVNIYNLEVIGNCPIDYPNFNGISIIGAYVQGISIGKLYGSDQTRLYTTDYYIDINNLTAEKFGTGIKVEGAVGTSKISNIEVNNCFQSGLIVQSSIITLENMTFGACGASAIEVAPDKSDVAGVNENENSQITFAGFINADACISDGNTEYFQKYTISGYTIPQIINLNIQGLEQAGLNVSHIMMNKDEDTLPEFKFVSLKFGGSNASEINYAAYQAGGIVDITTLAGNTVDTTHQYIKMTVYAGSASVGEAIFYNWNYVAPAN